MEVHADVYSSEESVFVCLCVCLCVCVLITKVCVCLLRCAGEGRRTHLSSN